MTKRKSISQLRAEVLSAALGVEYIEPMPVCNCKYCKRVRRFNKACAAIAARLKKEKS